MDLAPDPAPDPGGPNHADPTDPALDPAPDPDPQHWLHPSFFVKVLFL
jgi:hypothetical protein